MVLRVKLAANRKGYKSWLFFFDWTLVKLNLVSCLSRLVSDRSVSRKKRLPLIPGFPLLPGEDEADQMACIVELLGMPPQRLVEQGKRAKNFISSKGLPRYCTAATLPDGGTVLSGGQYYRLQSLCCIMLQEQSVR